MIAGRQAGEYLFEHRLVLADQPALGAPFLAAGENIERCAADPAELCEDAEGGENPRTVGPFAQMTALRVAIGEQRRGQMETQLIRSLKPIGDPLQEIGFRVEPS